MKIKMSTKPLQIAFDVNLYMQLIYVHLILFIFTTFTTQFYKT